MSPSHRLEPSRPGWAATRAVAVALAVSFVWTACGPPSSTDSDVAGADASTADPAAAVETAGVDVPAAPGAMAPELALVGVPGGLDAAFTWLEPVPDASASTGDAGEEPVWRLRFARLGSSGWSEPVTVVAGGPVGSGLPGEEAPLFANWADRPGVVQGVLPSSRSEEEPRPLFVHWLAMNGESVYAYEVRMARSDDGGRSWRPLGRLHSDDRAAEHGFVSYVTDPRSAPKGGGVRAVWLDGRATPEGEPMTLRTALVGEEIDRASEQLLDDSVCDCCSTTGVATAAGPLVVYRDRTADEVRDHRVVRGSLEKSGETVSWSAPELLHRDGWTIPACPVNGPAAGIGPGSSQAGAGETVWVAWFTAADGAPRVLAAVSTDGGATFGEPVEVDGPSTGAPLGRLDLAVEGAMDGTAPGGAIVSWLDREEGEAVIRLRRLSAAGRLGPVVDVARSDTSRASGVPRLLALPEEGGARLLVAWVDPGGADGPDGDRPRSIQAVSLPAASVPAVPATGR